ncbi:MAG: ComEC/Rec2 family competence protein [Verrucomicrobiota bacterium]|nr:ComEC/Rec2 family competence protein [Verrucomicrobiota bacterium]
MAYPMLKIVVVFATGIWLDHMVPLPTSLWLALAIIAGLGFLAFRNTRRDCLISLLLLTGASLGSMEMRSTHPSDLRQLELGEGWYVTIEGKLLETPRPKIQSRNGIELESSLTTIKVHQISHGTRVIPASGIVLVKTWGVLPDTFYMGVPTTISGVLTRPPEPLADDLFDYGNHLRQRGIYQLLSAETPDAWAVNPNANYIPKRPWTDQFRAWAMKTMMRGLPVMDDSIKLQWAMVLGWKTWLHDDMLIPFRWSGSMHVFAISGMHVAIVAGLALGCMRLLPIAPWICILIASSITWAYIAVSGWQTSAIRAGVMMSIMSAAWLLNRPTMMVNTLFTAAWVILVWQPSQLFQVGFQLSFGVVLSLTTITPRLHKKLLEWTQPDPWILRERWTWQEHARSWVSRKASLPLAISLAAWLGSLPIIWQQFHLVTPVGVLGNLILVPLVGLVISCAMGSLFCAAWAPALTELFNHSGWFWMQSMLTLSHWMADLRGSHFYVAPLPDALLYFYFTLIVLLATGLGNSKFKRVFAAGCACMILGMLGLHFQKSISSQSIDILPVANGEAIWVNQPGSRMDFLLDGGNARAMEHVTIPFLESQGVDHLPSVWISHGDAHHMAGFSKLAVRYPPSSVIAFPGGYRSPYFKEAMNWTKKNKLSLQAGQAGTRKQHVEILYPSNSGLYRTADDATLVLLIHMAGHRVLLLGDLSREGMVQLGNLYPALKVDVLVVNRPDQRTPFNHTWMRRLEPRMIVVSGIAAGRQDRWVQTLKANTDRGMTEIWDTGSAGLIRLRAAGKSLEVTPTRGKQRILKQEKLPVMESL